MRLDNSNSVSIVDNDRKNEYVSTFGNEGTYIPKPLGKRVYLEIENQTKSGIFLGASRHQDAPMIKKCVKRAGDCLFAKEDTYYLVNMMNRPELVWGPNGTVYFMVWEHDLISVYEPA